MSADSVNANRQHLELLCAKRDRLADTARDALEPLCAAIARAKPTPSEAVELWQWARTLGLPHASEKIADATGYGLTHLSTWARFGTPDPPHGSAYSGEFPLGYAVLPRRGTPTVYVLFAGDEAVYIGRSENIRLRMQTHQREKRELYALTRWWVMVCTDRAHMAALERELIKAHQPLLNVVGR